MNKPLVSVIMPLYNAEKYVAEAISSLLNQTYDNWELIVVNDGSTDRSLAIANRYKSDKIRIFSIQNKGAAAARNFGYQNANGSFVKFFDADDILNPTMLEKQVELVIHHEDDLISAKWGRFYNDDLGTFYESKEDCWQDLDSVEWIQSSWIKGESMTQPGIFLIPRKTLDTAGLWNEELSLIDDFEFFTRIILASKHVRFCDQAILFYRSGIQNSLSDQKSDTAVLSAFKAIDLATKALLKKDPTEKSKLCCANAWQAFIFEHQSNHQNLSTIAENKVRELGGTTLKFKGSRLTNLSISIMGWKLTMELKQQLKKWISNNS